MSGMQEILKERLRQFDLGYDEAHDNEHHTMDLSHAALCYRDAVLGPVPGTPNASHEDWTKPPPLWPWRPEDWKFAQDTVPELLAKSGALYLAAAEKFMRNGQRGPAQSAYWLVVETAEYIDLRSGLLDDDGFSEYNALPPGDWVLASYVAQQLQVGTDVVRRWIREEKLEGIKVEGRLYVTKPSLEAWCTQHYAEGAGRELPK